MLKEDKEIAHRMSEIIDISVKSIHCYHCEKVIDNPCDTIAEYQLYIIRAGAYSHKPIKMLKCPHCGMGIMIVGCEE